MTENKLKLIGALIGAVLMTGFGFGMYALATSCSYDDDFEVVKAGAIDYYGKNAVYTTAIGQVIKFSELENICRVEFDTGSTIYKCDLPKASAVELTVNEFDFSAGTVYKFTFGSNYYTHRDYILINYPLVAAVSVSDSRSYLSQEHGVDNLIDFIDSLKK